MSWKFWKKDDLALPELSKNDPFKSDIGGLDLSNHFEPSGQMPQSSFQPSSPSSFAGFTPGAPPPTSYAPPGVPVHEGNNDVSKDLEVIAAKLDTIRAQLEMLNTRVANLEHQGQGPQPKRPWY